MGDGIDQTAGALLRRLPLLTLTGDGSVRHAFGQECGGIAGHDSDTLRGQLFFEFVHPNELVTAVDRFVDVRDGRLPGAEVSARVRGADGAYRDVELLMTSMRNAEVLVWCRDTTATAMAAEAWRHAALHSALVEQSGVLYAVIQEDGEVQYLNRAAQDAFAAVADANRSSLLSLVHPEDVDRARKRIRAAAAAPRRRAACTLRINTADGWRRYDVSFANLTDDPAVAGLAAEAVDVTDRVNAEAELVRRTLHDPLTGLANRVLMRDRLLHALGRLRRGAPPLMLAYLDLDDFKRVNDTLGHEAGDLVLETISARLQASVRPGDTVARVGGDEFVVVCPDILDNDSADLLARRIHDAAAEPIDIAGAEYAVTASIGAIVIAEPIDSTDALRAADAAMYQAKVAGKGRIIRTGYAA